MNQAVKEISLLAVFQAWSFKIQIKKKANLFHKGCLCSDLQIVQYVRISTSSHPQDNIIINIIRNWWDW